MRPLDFKKNHTMWWGKMYRASEVKPQWRKPSEADISMAFDIIGLANQSIERLGGLLDDRKPGDKVWSNEFCRALSVVDKVLRGSYNLLMEINAKKEGGKPADT